MNGNLNDIKKYIPGFRSNKKWKIIVASVYYVLSLFVALGGIGQGLVALTLPFFTFSLISSIKKRGKISIATCIIAFGIIVVGANLVPHVDEQGAIASNKSAENKDDKKTLEAKTPENKPSEAKTPETKTSAKSTTDENKTNEVATNKETSDSNNSASASGTSTVDNKKDTTVSNTNTENSAVSSNGNTTSNNAISSNSDTASNSAVSSNTASNNTSNNQTTTKTQPSTNTTTEKANTQAPAQTQKPEAGVTVYWLNTKGSYSYHKDSNCRYIKGKNVSSGSIQDATNAKHSDPCDICAK
jgi:hypothetical protein